MCDGQVSGQLARGGEAGEGGAAVPLAQTHREGAEGDGEHGQQLRGGLARVPHQLQRGHHCRGHAGLTDNDDDNDNDTGITGEDSAGDMLRGLASLRD